MTGRFDEARKLKQMVEERSVTSMAAIKEEFEQSVQLKINQIVEDYDLNDLNSNDKLLLKIGRAHV